MESKYYILCLYDNHWKPNAIATAIYSQWYQIYDRKMKPLSGNENSSENNNNESNNIDNNTSDESEGPPKKKTRATTQDNNDTHFIQPNTKNVATLQDPLWVLL